MKTLAIAASLVAIVAMPALAAPGGPAMKNQPVTRAQVQATVRERFAAMDADRDGVVTKAEYDAHRAKQRAEHDARRGERRAEQFGRLDANKDNQLSQAEFAARADRGPDGKRGGPGRPDGHGGRRHGGPGFGPGGRGGPDGMFALLDADRNGRVTLAEATAGPLAMFDKADTNRDGTVTPEERRAAREAMRADWKAKRG